MASENDVLPQQYIAAACEVELRRHGDTFRGAGYTKTQEETDEVYDVMLSVVRERDEPVTLLDLGCGLAHLCDYLRRDPVYRNIEYTGLDISAAYVEAARARRPEVPLLLMDVLEPGAQWPVYDYVVLNGLFNYRGTISETRMLDYWKRLTAVAYEHCRRAIAFNVMSAIVDWRRDDLFHLPFDTMAQFVGAELSRHFVVHHDYRAREYTTHVYRQPRAHRPRGG